MSFFRWVSHGHSTAVNPAPKPGKSSWERGWTAVGFAKLIFTFLIQISALIPNLGISRHSLRRELSLLGEPKCLYEEKLSRLPGLPYLPRWDNSSTRVVSPPRQLGVINLNSCLNFTTTQGKDNSPRVTPGKVCLGYPRPYKWGL